MLKITFGVLNARRVCSVKMKAYFIFNNLSYLDYNLDIVKGIKKRRINKFEMLFLLKGDRNLKLTI